MLFLFNQFTLATFGTVGVAALIDHHTAGTAPLTRSRLCACRAAISVGVFVEQRATRAYPGETGIFRDGKWQRERSKMRTGGCRMRWW